MPVVRRRRAMLTVLAAFLFLAADPNVAAPLPALVPKPRIVVLKAQRELRLYSGNTLLKTYRIGLGLNPVPPKQRSGDHATPEGSYFVCLKNPHSQYLLSLGEPPR